MRDKVFLMLFYIGFGITFNIVGKISLSEIYLFLACFWYIPKLRIADNVLLVKITWLYICLLLAQLIPEIIVGNSIENGLKGISVTIVSYLHVMFLLSYFVKRPQLIIYALIGQIINMLAFPTFIDTGDTYEDATYLKFFLAPIIINILLITTIYTINVFYKKMLPFVFFTIALFFLIFGARSLGVIVFLTGAISLFLDNFKNLYYKNSNFLLFIVLLLFYMFYALYVYKVQLGDWGSDGNRVQLARVSNPYNPILLLLSGRTETFVGSLAFLDKFWFGHGAWAIDESGKYHFLMRKLHDVAHINETIENKYLVPSHSVILGYAVANGVLALIFILRIFQFYLRLAFHNIYKGNPFIYCVTYFAISTIWNGLFSPTSHFRINMPIMFSIFLALNLRKQYILKSSNIILDKQPN